MRRGAECDGVLPVEHPPRVGEREGRLRSAVVPAGAPRELLLRPRGEPAPPAGGGGRFDVQGAQVVLECRRSRRRGVRAAKVAGTGEALLQSAEGAPDQERPAEALVEPHPLGPLVPAVRAALVVGAVGGEGGAPTEPAAFPPRGNPTPPASE